MVFELSTFDFNVYSNGFVCLKIFGSISYVVVVDLCVIEPLFYFYD